MNIFDSHKNEFTWIQKERKNLKYFFQSTRLTTFLFTFYSKDQIQKQLLKEFLQWYLRNVFEILNKLQEVT